MTVIPVSDTWRIELDECSWAIAKHQPRKDTRRKQWTQISWFPTLEQAAQSLAQRLLHDHQCKPLAEVLEAQRRGSAMIADAIAGSGFANSWLEQKRRAE